MKYWKGNDIEHLVYEEGRRTMPYKHPAAIAISSDSSIRTEVEIIPNTMEVRETLDPVTFNTGKHKCVQVERRLFRTGMDTYNDISWVALELMGYSDEPINYDAFDYAMEII